MKLTTEFSKDVLMKVRPITRFKRICLFFLPAFTYYVWEEETMITYKHFRGITYILKIERRATS